MTIFTHPQGAAFEDISLPPPPRLEEGEEGQFLVDVDKYLKALFMTWGDLETSIRQGWLIKDARVVSISADKVIANSIFTQDLFVGVDQNIRLLGSTDRIEIWDKQATPKLRIILAKLSAVSDDWGIEVRDSGGTVRFKTGTATFIDGAIITNATITNAKIVDATITGGKVASNTITNSNISDVSFGKLSAGTITTTGVAKFSGGADIEMMATASGDENFIVFKNSGGSDRGYLTYSAFFNVFRLISVGCKALLASATNFNVDIQANGTGDINLLASGDDVIVTANTLRPITDASCALGTSSIAFSTLWVDTIDTPGIAIACSTNLAPTVDNTVQLGSSGNRWKDVKSVLINGSDYCFENGFRLTEPNHVYKLANADDGIYFMNNDWQPVAYLTKRGNFYIKGFVRGGWNFDTPDIARRESDN